MTDRSVPGTDRHRGHGVGIEVTDRVVRGVRIGPDSPGRIEAAGEFPVGASSDDGLLDAFVLLHAELGAPIVPTRIGVFPPDSALQRIDVTGRSDTELNDIRTDMRTTYSIGSSLTIDDGPRRWMLIIRWDDASVARVRTIAEHAGFADVALEPSPSSIARVAGADATYIRRLVAQGDAHHAVVSHRIPVAAMSTRVSGRTHPAVDIARVRIAVAGFDEFLPETTLAESIDRAASRADSDASAGARDGGPPVLDLAGVESVGHPDHDVRSPQRQVVALGAAVGAGGLLGPVDGLHISGPRPGIGGDPLDRPWAIERLPTTDDRRRDDETHGIERVTRWFRPRRQR